MAHFHSSPFDEILRYRCRSLTVQSKRSPVAAPAKGQRVPAGVWGGPEPDVKRVNVCAREKTGPDWGRVKNYAVFDNEAGIESWKVAQQFRVLLPEQLLGPSLFVHSFGGDNISKSGISEFENRFY